MRLRDRWYLWVSVAMAVSSVSVSATSIAFNLLCARRVRADVASLQSRMESAERTIADASGVAMAAAESMRTDTDLSPCVDPLPSVELLGYGQTRTRKNRLVYRDTRVNGEVRREYIARIPFSQNQETDSQ